MPKRKAGDAGLPATIRQEPASTSGSGPFVVYFPSSFEPNGSIPCEWQTYAHSERKNQYVVVAKTVGGAVMRGASVHAATHAAASSR